MAPKTCKLSSVKKLIVLGAVAEVPENYVNVKVILDQLNIEALEFTMSSDIKMRKFVPLVNINSGLFIKNISVTSKCAYFRHFNHC